MSMVRKVSEEELLLCAVRAIGIGCWWPALDLFGYIQISGELVHLGFIQVRNGSDVHAAIAILHEESLECSFLLASANHREVA